MSTTIAVPSDFINKLKSVLSDITGRDVTDLKEIPDIISNLNGYLPLEWNALLQDNFHIVYTILDLSSFYIESIRSYAFFDCPFSSIKIPDSVKTIGPFAFADNINITSIDIGSNIISIDPYTFLNCDALTEININKPEGSITGAPWGATNATINWRG